MGQARSNICWLVMQSLLVWQWLFLCSLLHMFLYCSYIETETLNSSYILLSWIDEGRGSKDLFLFVKLHNRTNRTTRQGRQSIEFLNIFQPSGQIFWGRQVSVLISCVRGRNGEIDHPRRETICRTRQFIHSCASCGLIFYLLYVRKEKRMESSWKVIRNISHGKIFCRLTVSSVPAFCTVGPSERSPGRRTARRREVTSTTSPWPGSWTIRTSSWTWSSIETSCPSPTRRNTNIRWDKILGIKNAFLQFLNQTGLSEARDLFNQI